MSTEPDKAASPVPSVDDIPRGLSDCRHPSTRRLTATQGDGAIVTQWYCDDCGERVAVDTCGSCNGTFAAEQVWWYALGGYYEPSTPDKQLCPVPKRLWPMGRTREHPWTYYDSKLRRLVTRLSWDHLMPRKRDNTDCPGSP